MPKTASRSHQYTVALSWEGNLGRGTAAPAAYSRRFRAAVGGKPDLLGTSDPAFRGEPGRHNPEELLLAAVASCHMLFYLSLCAAAGVVVEAYADAAEGTLEVDPTGGGRFTGIALRPRVTLAAGSDPEAARALHRRANELCFIANSCAFPIGHDATIEVAAPAAEVAR